MSLNVENLFVKSGDQAKVAGLIELHWRNPLPSAQPNWGLPSSIEVLMEREAKRKLVISPVRDGWVAIVESVEVIDFALANYLSEKLETTVLAIQIGEAAGAAGYASAVRGNVLESVLNQKADDPLATVRDALRKYRVPFDVILFREAVQKIAEGWIVKGKSRS